MSEVRYSFVALAGVSIFLSQQALAQNRVVVIPMSGNQVNRVAKTGQITIKAPGDDGDLQKGLDWPAPRFIDHGNGTVTDMLTGLMWLKDANCPNGSVTWATALSDVVNLNDYGTTNTPPFGKACDSAPAEGIPYADWRLPNVKELQSLISFGQTEPALPPGHPFSNVESTGSYWSSTTSPHVIGTDDAWLVDIGNYGVSSYEWKEHHHNLWPVRGGQ